MAFCENCGKEMSDQAVSCPNCGHPRGDLQAPIPGFASGPILPTGQRASEWWKRFVALIIDGVILFVPITIMSGLLSLGTFDNFSPVGPDGTYDFAELANRLTSNIAATFFFIAVRVCYYAFLNGSERGQTVGKMAMRIQVRDMQTGGPIGYGRGFIRSLIPQVLSGFTCGILRLIDGLWPLWDARRQALHDKMANSIVVDVP